MYRTIILRGTAQAHMIVSTLLLQYRLADAVMQLKIQGLLFMTIHPVQYSFQNDHTMNMMLFLLNFPI